MASLKNIFTTTLLPKVSSNRFDLTHDIKMSFKMGNIVPTAIMEVLPGDVFRITPHNMLRFAPLVSPVMHRIRVTTRYFFVPNRILWPNWEKFMTGGDDGQQTAEYPYIQSVQNWDTGQLGDYMGLPLDGLGDFTIKYSAMQFAAYWKVYDEFFRDQNLVESRFAPLVDGDNTSTYGPSDTVRSQLARVAWMHDYFTSCLPEAQKGDAVSVPLTTQDNIPVQFNELTDATQGIPKVRNPYNSTPMPDGTLESFANPGSPGEFTLDDGAKNRAAYDPDGSLVVDVQSDAVDINTLRLAFRVQEWLERNARGGTRYIEKLLATWGVRSSDKRLQRPEYIGGTFQNMVISEVLSTAQTGDNTDIQNPVGQMAGHGISVGGGKSFNYRAEEHGFILGVIYVTPVTAYQQGVHRSWSRFDRLDFADPIFANIGEQEVLAKEVFANTDDWGATFGYIPRYSEYKFMNSRVAGEFRNVLAHWHLGRIFSGPPLLNQEFIECNPSTRIFAVEDGVDHIYCDIINQCTAIRKLPRFGIPQI